MRHAATQAEILTAAWQLAAESGLAGLSLRDVAKRVGMQSPSLYSYFDSKNAVYDAMFAQAAAEYRRAESELVFAGSPTAEIRTALRFHASFCTADPVRHELLFHHSIPGFAPSARSLEVAPEPFGALRVRLKDDGVAGARVLDLVRAIGTGIVEEQLGESPSGDRWVRLIDDAAELIATRVAVAPRVSAAKPDKKRKKAARK